MLGLKMAMMINISDWKANNQRNIKYKNLAQVIRDRTHKSIIWNIGSGLNMPDRICSFCSKPMLVFVKTLVTVEHRKKPSNFKDIK